MLPTIASSHPCSSVGGDRDGADRAARRMSWESTDADERWPAALRFRERGRRCAALVGPRIVAGLVALPDASVEPAGVVLDHGVHAPGGASAPLSRRPRRQGVPTAISPTMIAATTQSTTMQNCGHQRVLATKWLRCCQRSSRPWSARPATGCDPNDRDRNSNSTRTVLPAERPRSLYSPWRGRPRPWPARRRRLRRPGGLGRRRPRHEFVRLAVQDLLDEVVEDEPMASREGVNEPGDVSGPVGMRPGRQRGQLQPGRPPLGARLERRHKCGIEVQLHHLVEEHRRFVGGEPEVGRPHLHELATRPQTRQRERRVRPSGHRQRDVRRQVVQTGTSPPRGRPPRRSRGSRRAPPPWDRRARRDR